MIFPISKVKYGIIKAVYQEKKINISALLNKIRVSPGIGYRYIRELLSAGILQERLEGRKPTSRYLYPCFSETGKLCFALIEEEGKIAFFEKQKPLKGPLEHFAQELKGVGVILIFGSFARGGESKESDLDLLIIGKKPNKKRIEAASERCLVTVPTRVSLRITSEKEFLNSIKNEDAFALQLEKEHRIVSGSFRLVELFQKSKNRQVKD